jgi:P4 family phage/plasmid primase-like protien
MSNKGYSIGTLKYWAKLDNEKLYKKIMAECLDKYVEITIGSDGAHYDIAVITSKLMADKAVYDGQMKAWFFVDERTNLWETDKDGTFLRKIFAVDVIKVFLKASHNYSKLAFECEQQFKTGYEEKSKKSLNIAKQLKNASFCDSLLKCCKCTLMNKGFFEKFIDKKVELFAFNNCVFDCDMKKFRPIEPTDYIMTTTGYDYNSNVEQKYIDELVDILNAIQPNTENLHYLLDTLSSRLYGKNLLQLFFIWTGVGANGKSVIGNLLDSAFGGYFGKIGADTITKPTKNANSTSEFSRVSGCRCVIVEEPDEGDKLQVSMLKEHSGDSKIRTRGLFQESYEYTPQYAITIYCNEIPELSKVGGHSIARRLRVIHFPTKFCESPSKPMEKLGDNELNKRLSGDIGYKHALIKILIDNWCNKDLKRKIETPSCILENSKEYMDNCNYVKKFLDERYEYSEYDKDTNKDAKVRSSELYDLFKMTFKDLKMTDKTFKTLVEAEGYKSGKISCMYYFNIKRKEDVEDKE